MPQYSGNVYALLNVNAQGFFYIWITNGNSLLYRNKRVPDHLQLLGDMHRIASSPTNSSLAKRDYFIPKAAAAKPNLRITRMSCRIEQSLKRKKMSENTQLLNEAQLQTLLPPIASFPNMNLISRRMEFNMKCIR